MKKIHRILKLIKFSLYRLGLLGLVSKIQNKNFRILENGYSPRKFWDSWSAIYFNQPYRKLTDISHEGLLQDIIRLQPKKILEVGCGFGRNLKFILENIGYPVRLFGLDLSESFLTKAATYVGNDVDLACADIGNLPLQDDSIDFVFTYGTLMHVQPKNLKSAILELKRISRKDLVIIEEVMPAVKNKSNLRLNDYTFVHDYKKIISDMGFEIKEIRIYNNLVDLLYLHCQKR